MSALMYRPAYVGSGVFVKVIEFAIYWPIIPTVYVVMAI